VEGRESFVVSEKAEACFLSLANRLKDIEMNKRVKLVGVLVTHAWSSCGHGYRDRRRDVVRARRILDRSELYE